MISVPALPRSSSAHIVLSYTTRTLSQHVVILPVLLPSACMHVAQACVMSGSFKLDVMQCKLSALQHVFLARQNNMCGFSTGQFYECLNMASLYKLPCIFVVENNLWAIGMQHNRATNPTAGDDSPYIYKKGPAFGMPGILVDGMDVRKVNCLVLLSSCSALALSTCRHVKRVR